MKNNDARLTACAAAFDAYNTAEEAVVAAEDAVVAAGVAADTAYTTYLASVFATYTDTEGDSK